MYRLYLFIFVITLFTFSCKQRASVSVTETADSTAVNTDTIVEKIPSLTLAWETDTTLHTPESVLYDPANNLLYVSNIGGVPPVKKDGDGFISQVSLDGKIINRKWATGFDAPKGMSLIGNTLYVTDIDRLKAVDTKTGKTINTWKVSGATFLNDVTVTQDSVIYFTDSDKSTIHRLRHDRLSVVRVDTSLGGTNGIFVEENHLYLAGSAGNVFKMNIDDQTTEKIGSNIPNGDGIERYNNGWIVSNWSGEIYFIDDMGEITEILDSQEAKLNTADIEVIESKNLLIIPTFFGNKVVAYTLKVGG
jgi:sugar lactone lactonase YvrE